MSEKTDTDYPYLHFHDFLVAVIFNILNELTIVPNVPVVVKAYQFFLTSTFGYQFVIVFNPFVK